jgi:cell division protein WhiA
MSPSEDLRNELAAISPESDCDRLAELSGLFRVAGSVHLRGRGEVAVHLDLVSAAVARRAFALLRAFDVDSEIRSYQQHAFERATRYQLHVEGKPYAYATLHRAGVLDASHRPVERPPQRVLARRCCRRAYLRGGLLGAGSLSGPRDPHVEIRTTELEGARFIAGIAAREGADLHVLDRGRHAVAYAKGTEPIADLLIAAGASDTVLMLEESSVLAAIRGDANRLANADHANLVRTSRAAHAQLEALGRLDLDALPDDLRELATLRVRHPTASIADLGRRCRPPLTKSSAYRRLMRLQELAAE